MLYILNSSSHGINYHCFPSHQIYLFSSISSHTLAFYSLIIILCPLLFFFNITHFYSCKSSISSIFLSLFSGSSHTLHILYHISSFLYYSLYSIHAHLFLFLFYLILLISIHRGSFSIFFLPLNPSWMPYS